MAEEQQKETKLNIQEITKTRRSQEEQLMIIKNLRSRAKK